MCGPQGCQKFVERAKVDLAWAAPRVERFICETMQAFTPEAGRYDVIWLQWCIGCVTDDDLVAFLGRCCDGLAPGGMIIIKDNVLDGPCAGLVGGKYLVDHDDNSVRPASKARPRGDKAASRACLLATRRAGDPHDAIPRVDPVPALHAAARRSCRGRAWAGRPAPRLQHRAPAARERQVIDVLLSFLMCRMCLLTPGWAVRFGGARHRDGQADMGTGCLFMHHHCADAGPGAAAATSASSFAIALLPLPL